MIEVYNENNEKIKCEVLFTFKKDNKQFIVYMDNEDDILTSYYKIDDNKLIITPITKEEDYDIVDKHLEEWWKQND